MAVHPFYGDPHDGRAFVPERGGADGLQPHHDRAVADHRSAAGGDAAGRPGRGGGLGHAHPHAFIEKNAVILLVLSLLTVAIGGLVEIVPLFTIETTVEHVQGVRPYSPLELRGRDIYIREGCYLCHSQMIRTLRDDVERYGHYSLAAESMYDHPFQWGSKRIGPDLARVGGKYSERLACMRISSIRAGWCRNR